MSSSDDSLYRSSGVDIAKGDAVVNWLQKSDSVDFSNPYGAPYGGLGGFSGLFKPNFKDVAEPLLVSATDGVGTKLLLALQNNQVEGLGKDLVAMCINDLYCIGARPLFFLDYFATGKLDDAQFKSVLTGIKNALKECHTFLLGGETAEMPGLYEGSHFDLCGFVVGMVDAPKMLRPELNKDGDKVIALASSGFHSNGYSLVRKLLQERGLAGDKELVQNLLRPTTIYCFLPDLINKYGTSSFHGLANITGGGISGNLCRVIPESLQANIDGATVAAKTPQWMKDFLHNCDVSLDSVESTFNLGCGMAAVVSPEIADDFVNEVKQNGVDAYEIGHITKRKENVIHYTSPL